MDKCHHPLDPPSRCPVYQLNTTTIQLRERSPEIVNLEAHMMEAFASTLDESPNDRLRPGRLKQLELAAAHRYEPDLDTIPKHHLPQTHVELTVHSRGIVDVSYRYSDVI